MQMLHNTKQFYARCFLHAQQQTDNPSSFNHINVRTIMNGIHEQPELLSSEICLNVGVFHFSITDSNRLRLSNGWDEEIRVFEYKDVLESITAFDVPQLHEFFVSEGLIEHCDVLVIEYRDINLH